MRLFGLLPRTPVSSVPRCIAMLLVWQVPAVVSVGVVLDVKQGHGAEAPAFAENLEPKPAKSEQLADVQVALVRVHLPLTGNADQVLQATITRARDRLIDQARLNQDARRPILVLQLEPHRQAGAGGVGSQFERVLSLARYLTSREVASIKTVAFVPQSIRGHGTLIALACEEIVMSADATIGEAAIDEPAEAAVSETVIGAYREIAESRRTMPLALAAGMIDASAEVLQVETQRGTEFVLKRDLAAAIPDREIINEQLLVPSGTLATFAGREGRQFGFVKFLASDRQGLGRALKVPPAAIREEDTLAGEWLPTVIDINGPITPRVASRVETMLTTATEQGANWVCLRIDSSGGDLAASLQLATTIAKLDANSVRTVAYVPAEARAGATLVAMSCDEMVPHSQARIGAVEAVHQQPKGDLEQKFKIQREDQATQLEVAKISIRESLAPLAECNWSMLAAMIDPNIALYAYRDKATGEVRWMSEDEAAQLPDKANWQKGEMLVEANRPTVLSGQRSVQLGLAKQSVESYDELKQLYQLRADPPVAKPNWALEFVEALASPELAWILLAVGFYGLYLELKAPGIGFGAFVGCVAIMLFFWSQYLNGTAGWLEVILFLAGLMFVLIEIFVLPGFGIFGLGGGAMVIASIVLASLTFVRPRSEQDMDALTHSLGSLTIALVGFLMCVLISRRFLPAAPVFRHLVQPGMKPEERAVLEDRELVVDYSHLVGMQGVTTTHLRPAGKAEVDHQLIDVIAESAALDRGTPIEVVEAHANRVVVRATGPTRA